jgi:hypothetical protein
MFKPLSLGIDENAEIFTEFVNIHISDDPLLKKYLK